PSLEARDDTASFDECERRHLCDPEALREIRPLVDVDLLDAERVPLLARDMREQALHPPRGTGAAGREEDEQRAWVSGHPWPSVDESAERAGSPSGRRTANGHARVRWERWGAGTGSASASGSARAQAVSSQVSRRASSRSRRQSRLLQASGSASRSTPGNPAVWAM